MVPESPIWLGYARPSLAGPESPPAGAKPGSRHRDHVSAFAHHSAAIGLADPPPVPGRNRAVRKTGPAASRRAKALIAARPASAGRTFYPLSKPMGPAPLPSASDAVADARRKGAKLLAGGPPAANSGRRPRGLIAEVDRPSACARRQGRRRFQVGGPMPTMALGNFGHDGLGRLPSPPPCAAWNFQHPHTARPQAPGERPRRPASRSDRDHGG